MSVYQKVNNLVNKPVFFSYLIGLFLSTLFLGYAPSSIVFGVFVFFALRYFLLNKVRVELSIGIVLPIILYLFFCISFFWSVDKDLTVKGLVRTVSLLIIPLTFSIIPKFSVVNYKKVIDIFTGSNFILGIFLLINAVFSFLKVNSFHVFTYHDLVSVLDLNAIYVSVFFSFSFIYLLSLNKKSKYQKVALVLIGLIIMLLSSKTVIVAFVLCCVIFLLKKVGRKDFKKPRTLAVLALLIMLFTFASFQVVDRFKVEFKTNIEEVLTKDKFNKVYPWTGTSFRLLQLRILKQQIDEDGILLKGFGLFASRKDVVDKHLRFNTHHGFHTRNYHNMYAQIFSETGIIGLFILLAIILYSFTLSFKLKEFTVLGFSIIISFIFLTESFLWVQRGVYFTIILYCLFNRTAFERKNIEQ